MILKVDIKTGEIIMAGLETFIETPMSPTIQIFEEGKPKFEANRIKTYVIDGETAKDYEDPHKPSHNIHRCLISDNPSTKIFYLIDNQNKEKHTLIREGIRIKKERIV